MHHVGHVAEALSLSWTRSEVGAHVWGSKLPLIRVQ